MPEPVKLSREDEKAKALLKVVAAAKALDYGWSQSGFFDRQDPAQALALSDALAALR